MITSPRCSGQEDSVEFPTPPWNFGLPAGREGWQDPRSIEQAPAQDHPDHADIRDRSNCIGERTVSHACGNSCAARGIKPTPRPLLIRQHRKTRRGKRLPWRASTVRPIRTAFIGFARRRQLALFGASRLGSVGTPHWRCPTRGHDSLRPRPHASILDCSRASSVPLGLLALIASRRGFTEPVLPRNVPRASASLTPLI